MPGREIEPLSGISPNDPVEAFAASLAARDQDMFLIGHLPFMARLVAFLLAGDADRELVGYQPGSVVCLERTEATSWRMSWMLRPELLTDWQPVDTMAIARYMVEDLSKSASVEIEMTEAALAIAQEFPVNSPDPKLAARAAMLHDFYPFAPVADTYIRDGFPNLGSDSGTRAVAPPDLASPISRLTSRQMLTKARKFLKSTQLFWDFGGLERGSNNWLIHGSKTATGNPMMANDPHLGFDSPPKFWYAHLNTKRAGGEMNVQGLALAGTPGILARQIVCFAL